jgi:hypothetical protein
MYSLFCPICLAQHLSPVLEKFDIVAHDPETDYPVGGLAGYLCSGGHTFFVQRADVVNVGASVSELQLKLATAQKQHPADGAANGHRQTGPKDEPYHLPEIQSPSSAP